jgi:hypothetical protein
MREWSGAIGGSFNAKSGGPLVVSFLALLANLGIYSVVHRRVATRVQNNFYPVLKTKDCKQSGNLVQDSELGNLELRGDLIVRQADRDRGLPAVQRPPRAPFVPARPAVSYL